MTTVEQGRELGDRAPGGIAAAPGPYRPPGHDAPHPAGRPRVPRWAGLLAAAVGLGCLYALGALLPFWFLSSPDAGAAFFPSAGVTLAALALTPPRRWPLFLAAVAVAEVTVDLTHDQTVPMALGFAAANVVEPLLGAATLRTAKQRAGSLRAELLVFLGCAVVLGPLVGGAIGGLVATWGGDGGAWGALAGRWWVGGALGGLVGGPPLLAWGRGGGWGARPRSGTPSGSWWWPRPSWRGCGGWSGVRANARWRSP